MLAKDAMRRIRESTGDRWADAFESLAASAESAGAGSAEMKLHYLNDDDDIPDGTYVPEIVFGVRLLAE